MNETNLTIMRCGHRPNGLSQRVPGGPMVPSCVLCAISDRRDDATTPAETTPDVSGRVARCECGREVPSSFALAFFDFRPRASKDNFYCGCRGWD